MTTPQLATYVSRVDQLKTALQAGATHLILEDSKLSVRSYSDDFAIPHFENIALLAQEARAIHPDVTLSFNCDVLIHHRHLPVVKALIATLKKASITHIRVQDPGLSYFIREEYPDAHIHLCTETGTLNWAGIQYYCEGFDSQTLNHELPYFDIQAIQERCTNNYPFHIHVQGPILLQYSNRRYMAGFAIEKGEKPLSAEDAPIIQKLAMDHDHPTRRFPFYDNPHGHFMYLHFHRSLLKQIPKLMELELDTWIIDGRGQSLAYLDQCLRAYKTARDTYTQAPNDYSLDPELLDAIKATTTAQQLPGFFLSNKTDYELRKTIRMEEQFNLGELKGVIIDYAKGQWVTVDVKRPFSADDSLHVITQEKKLSALEPLRMQSLSNEPINSTDGHSLVKLRWQKGMQPKALIY